MMDLVAICHKKKGPKRLCFGYNRKQTVNAMLLFFNYCTDSFLLPVSSVSSEMLVIPVRNVILAMQLLDLNSTREKHLSASLFTHKASSTCPNHQTRQQSSTSYNSRTRYLSVAILAAIYGSCPRAHSP
ncbi:hypothetical protein H112_08177 [Trichophyton rubrum D6]|uniref:Uncharacterized protein n=2 Tax=Trichophyton TaxID=5550 RepID=A0A080WQ76_TRIRC|nr:uncharacterized protein TERG_11620 [Trichophyton rubrum CBS 118892]EZF10601.1 hypothetical protein H100_08204 [Trichophyton rubrum MR850]EZF37460.1 hypothetical protein H102_08161 [Trichophyton rubrum CBS 100081]EZF58752.1 hypothetical protein H104_08137 [Trichophyton rubrum CBS 289.86]EZF69345.1 hypothetical protein H105_08188 [Trichophyton soudanense CBS 452.61]EZF80019.1 hypothetical protein H110_08183 [Trichophyton rubrum MR1448]EZF90683.1 hypothetical protein H113_08251 [Trichophyton 